MNLKNPKKSKAQVGIEFLMILGGILFFIALLLLAIQNNQEKKIKEHQNIQLEEIAITVQNEINLALNSEDGYVREFNLPESAGIQDYEILLDSGAVYAKTTDDKHALALPIPSVAGNINKTYNKIQKINGTIYLNQ